jgi:hypothetical protein
MEESKEMKSVWKFAAFRATPGPQCDCGSVLVQKRAEAFDHGSEKRGRAGRLALGLVLFGSQPREMIRVQNPSTVPLKDGWASNRTEIEGHRYRK